MKELLSFAKAVEALERGDAIHRYGSTYPYWFNGAYGLSKYTFSSGGTMVQNFYATNGPAFSADDTNAADWQVWPRANVEENHRKEREFYEQQWRDQQEKEKEKADTPEAQSDTDKPNPIEILTTWFR